MRRRHQYLDFRLVGLMLAILFILVAGYGLMHGSVYVLGLSQHSILTRVIGVAFIIALGLGIPYVVLKMGVHNAHLYDPLEKEVQLHNFPKDHNTLLKKRK